MKKKTISLTLLTAIFITVFACGPLAKFTDTFTNPTARERYQRQSGNDNEMLQQWQAAHDRAVNNGVTVSLPYGEKGTFNPVRDIAYSYSANFRAGEVLTAHVTKASTENIFIEVYQFDGKHYRLLGGSEMGSSGFEYPIKDSGNYKIVIQPEMAAGGNFFFALNKKPMYVFPVVGKSNAAIGSFWADVRDGGKRSHEGIDIFAKRGTPVVAATDGTVGFTGERGIGGKQVWLRTGLFGNSLYYAHLDRIAVSGGQSVKAGDTLGFVGNTGNAKTTVPHLHFGIYGMDGAVDPLPFVYRTADLKPGTYPKQYGKNLVTAKSNINLRSGPSTEYAASAKLPPNVQLTLLGRHKDWLHVMTETGQTGYVNRKYIKPA